MGGMLLYIIHMCTVHKELR